MGSTRLDFESRPAALQLKRGRWVEVMVFDEEHYLECQAFAISIPIL